MVSIFPQELLNGAVEMACYFFTTIGIVFSMLFAPRA